MTEGGLPPDGPTTTCTAGACPASCDDRFSLGGIPAAVVPDGPTALVAADFDGDGKLDVAVADYGWAANFMTVLPGRGDGTFGGRVDYPVSAGPAAIVAGDWNGDGKPDLATSNTNGLSLTLFFNDGKGGFGDQRELPLVSNPNGLVAADFDGDGKDDLAVETAQGYGTVSVLFGKGDGTFLPSENFVIGTLSGQLLGGDFDGDGHIDLIANGYGDGSPYHDGVLMMLAGRGGRSFKVTQVGGDLSGPMGPVAAGDFDGDGNLDLFAGVSQGRYQSGESSVLAGNGDGTFSYAGKYPEMYSVQAAAAADLIGGGRADLVVGASFGLGIFSSSSKGPPAVRARYAFETTGMIFGDFNGDGHQDMASIDPANLLVIVALNRGDGTFVVPPEYAAGKAPRNITVQDFTRDGRLDALASGADGSLTLLVGKGDGKFDVSSLQAGADTYSTVDVAVGDLNGDGNLDVVSADGSPEVMVRLAQGPGKFGAASTAPLSDDTNDPALGDLDGDGKLDLVVGHFGKASVEVLRGAGDGTFSHHADVDVATGDSFYVGNASVQLGDVNGDGKLDLIAFHLDITVALGRGDGTFAVGGRYQIHDDPQVPPDSYPPTVLRLRDVNGDGVPDLVAGIGLGVRVLLGQGDGTFADGQFFAVPGYEYQDSRGRGLALADVNGDGNVDVIAKITGPHGVAVLLGNGDGTFGCPRAYQGPAFAPIGDLQDELSCGGDTLAVGDLNGDLRPDLVVSGCPISALLNTRL